MIISPDMTEAYGRTAPFPHAVLDDALPADRLRRVAREIEAARIDPEAAFYGSLGKRRASDLASFPPETRALVEELNSPAFISALEALTGIAGLEPDPDLEGGGIHQIPAGGYLKVHTDFNWHRKLQMHRRVNVLIYLNEVWDENWGGCLELWSEDDLANEAGAPARTIAPLFNRMVVFSTTDFSYHGHPHALRCPPDRTRNSLALYYYSKDRPAEEVRFGALDMTNYRSVGASDLGVKHKVHQVMIRNPSLRRAARALQSLWSKD